MLIDSHTHLYSEQFNDDRKEMIQRALDEGVKAFLLPNIDIDSIAGLDELVSDFPKVCFPMYGLHPGNVGADFEHQLKVIKERLDHSQECIAIGEIGMDLYWDKTFIEEQKQAFRTQIGWAKERKLPIVIHARDAFEEIFEIIDEENDEELKGVFHCFTGDLHQAQHILNYGGFKLGIGGVVTYKNSSLPEVLKEIDLSNIILETDSPYLPPVPYRGKRNESAYIRHVAGKLVDIYQLDMQEIEEQTTANTNELFKLGF